MEKIFESVTNKNIIEKIFDDIPSALLPAAHLVLQEGLSVEMLALLPDVQDLGVMDEKAAEITPLEVYFLGKQIFSWSLWDTRAKFVHEGK